MPSTTHYIAWLSCLTLALSPAGCSRKSAEQRRPLRQAIILSAVFGDASFKSAKGEDWHPATTGFSLVSGDAVSTGPRSRAEVQTRGPVSLIRIGENTTFVLERSDSAGVRSVCARVLKGGVWGSVKSLETGEAFVLSGPAHASALRPSTFRMELQEDGGAGVFVYEGEVRVRRTAGPFGEPEFQNLARDEGLLMPINGPSASVTVAPDDPWRRGWKSARWERVEEELGPEETKRIEEKSRPAPRTPKAEGRRQ